MTVAFRPRPSVVRRDSGLYAYERALARRGLTPIAGVDEAGRGACAGPLVVAAVVLRRPVEGLGDSKLLTPAVRERLHDRILATGPAGAVPGGLEGRSGGRLRGGGVDRGEGDEGPADGLPRRGVPAVRLRRSQGVCHTTASSRTRNIRPVPAPPILLRHGGQGDGRE